MGDSIPFDSLSARTRAGTEVGDRVICDAIPFDSLTVRTEVGAETERPAPQAPQFRSRSRSRSRSRHQALEPRMESFVTLYHLIHWRQGPRPGNPRRRRPRSQPRFRSRSRFRRQAPPIPPPAPPSHLFSYELGQPLQSPCPCF